MSGRKVAFGVYRRYILIMNTKNLPLEKKVDALYDLMMGFAGAQTSMQQDISGLKSSQTAMHNNMTGMQKDIAEMKSDIKVMKKEVHSLVTVVPDALMMAAKSKDRLDLIDKKSKNKSPSHNDTPSDSGEFTPFTSGAFVA